jgi:ParB family chromosome partitioning protein
MKQKLGKGLDVLLQNIPEATNETAGITTLKIDIIKPNRYQPRKVFDEDKLNGLSESIKENGIIQPIIVTKREDSDYELIAGERRLEAAKLAGLERVPVIIRSVSRREQLQYAIIENIQREQLNPIEEANAYQMMIDDFGYTHEQLADAMGKSRSAVTNIIRLLKLPPEIQQMISQMDLSAGHARAILSVPEDQQVKFAELVKELHLSVRQSEELAQENKPPITKPTKSITKTVRLKEYEQNLHEIYQTKVQVMETAGKGKVIFHFTSKDELESLLSHLNK